MVRTDISFVTAIPGWDTEFQENLLAGGKKAERKSKSTGLPTHF